MRPYRVTQVSPGGAKWAGIRQTAMYVGQETQLTWKHKGKR